MVWISALAFQCKAVLILPSPINTYECTNSTGERDTTQGNVEMWSCFIFKLGWKSLKLQKEHSAMFLLKFQSPARSFTARAVMSNGNLAIKKEELITNSIHVLCSGWIFFRTICYINTVLTNIKEIKKERQNKFTLTTVSTTDTQPFFLRDNLKMQMRKIHTASCW